MEVYETEEQQVEALKKWWKENGISVIVGLVIGIGGIVGWRSWQGHQENIAGNASMAYQQVVDILTSGDKDQAKRIGDRLIQAHPDNAYAALTSFLLAKAAVERNNLEEARLFLQWILDHAGIDEVKLVARVRIARLLIQENRLDEAMALITNVEAGAFQAIFAEIRGDILVARGDIDGARSAYNQAMNTLVTASNRDLLRMKIDDLGSPESGAPEHREGTGS